MSEIVQSLSYFSNTHETNMQSVEARLVWFSYQCLTISQGSSGILLIGKTHKPGLSKAALTEIFCFASSSLLHFFVYIEGNLQKLIFFVLSLVYFFELVVFSSKLAKNTSRQSFFAMASHKRFFFQGKRAVKSHYVIMMRRSREDNVTHCGLVVAELFKYDKWRSRPLIRTTLQFFLLITLTLRGRVVFECERANAINQTTKKSSRRSCNIVKASSAQ